MAKLTRNFDEKEFFVHEQPPDSIRTGKLPRVAGLCQWLRDLAGSAGFVNGYWRSLERNRSVGGVDNSQHVLGEAADVSFPLISPRELMARVRTAIATGQAPAFGQIIYYTDTGHWHISLRGATKLREILLGTKENGVRRYSVFRSLEQLSPVPRAVRNVGLEQLSPVPRAVRNVGLILAAVLSSVFFFPTLA